MKKIIILVIALLVISHFLKCNPSLNHKARPGRKGAVVIDTARSRQMPRHIKSQKLPAEKTKSPDIITSTIQIETSYDGLFAQELTSLSLIFQMKENSGVGALFDQYQVKIISKHDYYLLKTRDERTGMFFFDKSVFLSPHERINVNIIGNEWIVRNINNMNRLLSHDELMVIVILEGEDEHGISYAASATTGMI